MQTLEQILAERLGAHARERLAIEARHDSHNDALTVRLFDFKEWYRTPAVIRGCLRVVGMLERARRNALDIRLVENELPIAGLAAAFEGFRLLHLSDLHVDINEEFVPALVERLRGIDYDICVMTGDFRSKTYGSNDATLAGMRRVRAVLKDPIYGVLGNHDSVRMLPLLEADGMRMLVNESITLRRGNASVQLAGVDDAHFFQLDDIPKVVAEQLDGQPSILLSHSPEVYRQAAEAGFDVMLSGHTHGGQICLPGRHPITLDADIPRRIGRGRWTYRNLVGYTSPGAGTSIVDVRINCPPEVTLHRLRCAP